MASNTIPSPPGTAVSGRGQATLANRYVYAKPSIINVCCGNHFIDHVSWKKHSRVKHPSSPLLYECSRCNKISTTINSASSHYCQCKPPVATEPPPTLENQCNWCERSFATKSGLGVHCRHSHPSEFEMSKSSERTKLRWSDEEFRVFALAELNLAPSTRFVNLALQELFPHRSLESIKHARKNPQYKIIFTEVSRPSATLTPASLRRRRSLPVAPTPDRTPYTPSLTDISIPPTPSVNVTPVNLRRKRSLPIAPTPDNTSFLRLLPTAPTPTIPPAPTLEQCDFADIIATNLSRLDKSVFHDRLRKLITEDLASVDRFEEISDAVKEEYTFEATSNKRTGNSNTSKHRRRIQLKRYARFQQLYRRNRANLADIILNDKEDAETFPSEEAIKDTFQNLFETISPSDDAEISHYKDSTNVYYPISIDEMAAELKSMPNKSAGSDMVSVPYLRTIQPELLNSIINYELMKKRMLTCWKPNRTTLIQKTKINLEDAGNWRPITLSSVFVRLLHRILAKRLSKAVSLNERQKAFRPVDGCAENTLLLDAIINEARQKKRNLQLVGIDLAKAFDSVSIHSIVRALKRHRVNINIINYIIDAYTDTTTSITCGPVRINMVKLLRGVKQGDPLSPILFNLVLDELLDLLPPQIGALLCESKVNSLAFADDLILLAETPLGMDHLITITSSFFRDRSMRINCGKCFSMRIMLSVKGKNIIIDKRPRYTLCEQLIEPTTYDSFFKYLGIQFNPHGKMKPSVDQLELFIQRLARSPLKPQQKLCLLRSNILPKILHKLVLGRVTKGLLVQFDRKIKLFVKELLGLPRDTPNGYIFGKFKDGGLGLPSLEVLVPKTTINRAAKLMNSSDPIMVTLYGSIHIQKLLTKCCAFLAITSPSKTGTVPSPAGLFATIDGGPLRAFRNNDKGQSWLTSGRLLTSGKMFRRLTQLRIGRLPTLENCNRGRDVQKKCRHCHRWNESLVHITQSCNWAHFPRIQRHDSVVDYISKLCEKKANMITLKEPFFTLPTCKLCPDLIVISGSNISVIDVSIVTAYQSFGNRQTDLQTLDSAWLFKQKKYDVPELRNELSRRYPGLNLWFGAIIISMRGAWCSRNDETLKRCGIALLHRDILVVRSMEKTVKIWSSFMASSH